MSQEKKKIEQEKIEKLASFRKAKSKPEYVQQIASKIRGGDRVELSRGITLLESNREEDRKIAAELLKILYPLTSAQKSIRIGITGVPGVGKSTFIDSFGRFLTSSGKKVAVLAIDPSSGVSGGSILGDKTRMFALAGDENAYIRPTASGGQLGGVARATGEAIVLCEAAGYEVIIVETVGVGQSETDVHAMVDFFVLLMLAGAGDELQGIKRGIMEMADALIINKADGDNIKHAKRAKGEYASALHLFPQRENGWTPFVGYCSSLNSENIDQIWEVIEGFQNKMRITGWWEKNRQKQALFWLQKTLEKGVSDFYFKKDKNKKLIETYKNQVASNKLSPFQAAELILNELL